MGFLGMIKKATGGGMGGGGGGAAPAPEDDDEAARSADDAARRAALADLAGQQGDVQRATADAFRAPQRPATNAPAAPEEDEFAQRTRTMFRTPPIRPY